MKKYKKIPKFKSEKEERQFWDTHNSTDYIDWDKAIKNPDFENLKPTSRTISIRLPESLLHSIKTLANKRDIPYQSYMKTILADKVEEETAPKYRK